MNIFHIPITESTNTLLKQWMVDNPLVKEVAIYTSHQKHGRGQKGNSWEAEPGKNLTCSILLSPGNIKVNQQFIISQIVSLSIHQVLSQYTSGITIKWPNDIYWENRKISGILIEHLLNEEYLQHSIIGIGINLNQENFTSDAPNPISLTRITGERYDVFSILEQVTATISQKYQYLKNNPLSYKQFKDLYMSHLYQADGWYKFEDKEGVFLARIADIDSMGMLVLEKQHSHRLQKYAFKEVKFL